MDFKKEKEQQDFDAAREKHERAIMNWSTNNKDKRNVRTLLSTMHVSSSNIEMTIIAHNNQYYYYYYYIDCIAS
jgi:hypothetical protein